MAQRWYVVDVEAEGVGLEEASDEVLERLRKAIDQQSVRDGYTPESLALAVLSNAIVAPVVSWGGLAGGPSVRASVMGLSPIEVADRVRGAFAQALKDADLVPREIARIDVMTEEYQDAWLAEEPEEFVGVAEIADILGVSRQRVSELRGRPGFPKPSADLAAGPIWRLSSLQRFISDWPRRPGRPDTRRVRFEQLERLAEHTSSEGDDSIVRGRALTAREREVLALVAKGRSAAEIAERLGVTPKTLDSHVRSVVAKIRGGTDRARSTA